MTESRRHQEIEKLERAFWKSMVDNKPGDAVAMLAETALMISGHGVNRFDHAAYTKMASDSRFKLLGFRISKFDVLFPSDDVAIATSHVDQTIEMEGKKTEMEAFYSSTWVSLAGIWKCAAHMESPVPKT